MNPSTFDFITEMPGNRVTAEQIGMIAARYRWAATRVAQADVLEVACGPGLGLAILAAAARRVVAGDLDARCLAPARPGGEASLLRFDAVRAPFSDASFDAVLLFEAIYYLPDPDRFVGEAARLLRPDGRLLITAPNPAWPAFARSPQSNRYFAPAEFVALLEHHGFAAQVWGAFPQATSTSRQRILAWVRRVTTRLRLVPHSRAHTEAVRAFLKRVLYGRLHSLPRRVELSDASPETAPEALDHGDDRRHRVLYVEGIRGDTPGLQSDPRSL